MKLKFKHQKFQEDAAKAVVDVFAGQPKYSATYTIDQGYEVVKPKEQLTLNLTYEEKEFQETQASIGFKNHPIIPQLSDGKIASNDTGTLC